MLYNKLSVFFTRCIYIIFALFIIVGSFGGALTTGHKSYAVCFAVAVLLFIAAVFLRKKYFQVLDSKLKSVSHVKLCLILSALCIAVKSAWILLKPITPTVDYRTFYLVAQAVANNEYHDLFEYVALFPHILGYSYFLSFFYRIFGSGIYVAPIVNVLLTTASGIMIFSICRHHLGNLAAVCAYLLWIICPSSTIYNSMVLSEPFYTFLILLFLRIMQKLNDSDSPAQMILSAVIIGVITAFILRAINAARPIAAVLIIAILIWIFLLRGKDFFNSRKTVFLLIIAVISIGTYSVFGSLWTSLAEKTLQTHISTFPGYSVYVGFNEESGGSYSENDMQRLQNYYYSNGMDAQYAQSRMFDDAKERITGGNINIPKLMLEKTRTFLGNDEGAVFYSSAVLSPLEYSLLCMVSNIFYYWIVFFVLTGCIAFLRKPELSAMTLLPLFALGLIMAQLLVEVSGRYHYSIIPILIILASTGINTKCKDE